NLAKKTGDVDPTCPGTACVVTPTAGTVTVAKTLSGESGTQAGIAEANETLTYTITLTNSGGRLTNYSATDVLGAGLVYVSSSNGGVNAGQTTTWTNLDVPAGGSLALTLVARVTTPVTTASVRNIAKTTGDPDPTCPSIGCVEVPTAAHVTPLKLLSSESGTRPGLAEYGETLTYTITLTNSGGTAFRNYRFTENVPLGATLMSVGGATGFSDAVPGVASVNLQVADVPARGSAVVTVTFKVADPLPAGVTNIVNLINGGDIDPACGANCTVTTPVEIPAQLNIVKSVNVRDAKVGDMVRYQLLITNVGATNVTNGNLVDTPPAGFTYVAGSMAVIDDDGAFTLGASQYPLQIGGLDLAVGRQATVTYLLRVGAGVRQGVHANQVQAFSVTGRPISNIATAQLTVIADPLVDDSLILGTVFDDRDADGWQDPASLSGVRVQGGFAPGAYIAGSTTVDRGQGPQPEPDASSPMLHGINVGRITARQSDADPIEDHQVVIRQRLSALDFTGDFVLTNEQGVTVRMDAEGNTKVEKSGDAAKGLNGAEPTVTRRVSQGEGGYVVDYVIRNAGIDERGIPGVRIASVEGLLIETDQFGRYHLAGITGGDYARGRNFVLKVDAATLPTAAEFTTVNPLVRRITPGLPVRFDFGVKLPADQLSGTQQFDLELGEVIFEPGKAVVRDEYVPVIRRIADKVQQYQGGEVFISANGDAQGLALARATAVQEALLPMLRPETAKATSIVARADLQDPASMVVGVDQNHTLLGTVLFDTDKSVVKPAFASVIAQVAAALNRRGGGSVHVVGHTDKRASDAYNMALGLRRAKAVYEAIAEKLKPEIRAKVRVEFQNNAKTPARSNRKQGD
ncbi:putative repeat protein (TIGR01451 family), partial [Variovorax boronicumulans]|uniref:OmpA family protein n=1 Tax=Variovorax boronicumulans TaxID=436515 RepID=UPI00339440E1